MISAQKATFSGVYVRWDSFDPRNQKIAEIRSLTWQAVRISSPSTLPQKLIKLKELFGKNGYPDYAIKRTILETLQRNTDRQNGGEVVKQSDSNLEIGRLFLRLLWLGNVSIANRRQFWQS